MPTSPRVRPEAAVRARLLRSLWLVALAMALHELEEWNVAEWGARNFTNHTGISDEAIHLGLFAVTVLFAAWIGAATRFQSPVLIASLAFPAVALVAIGNSVQHVTWTILFAEYAPGVVSAVLLVLPASTFALARMLATSRMFIVPILLCSVLWGVASLQIVRAGNEMQPFQLVIHELCISLAALLGLPAG